MDEYIESIQKARTEREARLVSSSRNWLSLSGLFWLKPGRNTLGSGDTADVCLQGLHGTACAALDLHSDGVVFHRMGGDFLVNGLPTEDAALHSDQNGEPDLLEFGPLAMMVIIRGNQTLLRVWDADAPAYKNFHGLNYFPIDPSYRVDGRYIPYDPPQTMQTYDAIGTPTETEFSGRVEFVLDGLTCSLDAQEDDGELMLNFTDLSSKTGSYPGGRFLICRPEPDGRVEVDFNRTANWPCAYTSYATCPVPPPQNRLSVAIPAGEMRFHE
jgi:uncharacterized protein